MTKPRQENTRNENQDRQTLDMTNPIQTKLDTPNPRLKI